MSGDRTRIPRKHAIEAVPNGVVRIEGLLQLEKQILEMIVRGRPAPEVMDSLARAIEAESRSGTLCSVLLLDEEGRRLRHGAAPSLPVSYCSAIDGLEIGPRAGSCGTAAYTGKTVIVEDIATDPLWADFRDLAAQAGLRACWSSPIRSANGRVLGTFAIYSRRPGVPTAVERDNIQRAIYLAGITLDRSAAVDALRRSEERFRCLAEMSVDWYWEQDAQLRFVSTGGQTRNRGGITPEIHIGKLRWELPGTEVVGESWEAHRAVLAARKPFRDLVLRRSVGAALRYVSVSGEPMFDAAGTFTGYRGVARDITLARQAEERMAATVEDLRRFRLAMDSSADMIGLIDRATMKYIDVNPAFCRLLGYTREELLALGPQDILPVGRMELERAYDELIANAASPSVLNSYYLRKDGSQLPFESFRNVMRSGTGWLIVVVSRDIRERIAVERALRERELQLRLVTDSMPAMIAYFGTDHRYTYANLKYRTFFCGTTESVVGRTLQEVLGGDTWEKARLDIDAVLAGETRSYIRKLRRRLDGSLRQLDVSLVPHRDDEGRLLGAYSVLLDVTRRRRAEQSLQLRNRAIEASVNSIMITEATSEGQKIVYVNPAFERITGYAAAEVIGRPPRFLHGEDLEQRGVFELRQATRDLREATILLRNFRKDGSPYWNELHIAPVREGTGRVTHFIGVGNDVTQRIRQQEEIERQANFDALTGLPNRNLLNDRLAQAIVQAQRTGQPFALVFFDLDHLKRINDSLGHIVGDKVIQIVGRRISETLRAGDTIARVGGDEFVIVLADLKREDDAGPVAAKIMECIGQPLSVEAHEFVLTASLGIALYPKDGADVATLLRNADTALYRAKGEGRECFRFFTKDMNERVVTFLALENDLRRALVEREFWLQYQPIVRLPSGDVVGAEALIRWRHPDGSLVPPAQFIPVAEESGLIIRIGRWVIETAVRQAGEWNSGRRKPLYVSINLSARQFRDPQLVEAVAAALDMVRIDPSLIRLELTESTVMQDAEKAVSTLRALKQLGVKVAIDDFGTGYSSLAYLKRFPIDVLKIDRAFVRDLETDHGDQALSRAIVDLGRALELDVVAEGIETREQARLLLACGCRLAQGYLFGKAQDPDSFGLPESGPETA